MVSLRQSIILFSKSIAILLPKTTVANYPSTLLAQEQDIDMVKRVANCDPDTQTNTGNSPLHEACRPKKSLFCIQKCEEIVRYLVGIKHCNVNSQNRGGETPLQYACKHTARDVVKYLLSEGADPSVRDNRGQIPLMFVPLDKVAMIKALLKHGADPTPLYEAYHAYFKRHSTQSPPPTPLKVVFLGNTSTCRQVNMLSGTVHVI